MKPQLNPLMRANWVEISVPDRELLSYDIGDIRGGLRERSKGRPAPPPSLGKSPPINSHRTLIKGGGNISGGGEQKKSGFEPYAPIF